MSISGNYNTSQFEIDIVTNILKRNGFGLQSVKELCAKYNGWVTATVNSGFFTVDVLLLNMVENKEKTD